jgi:PleD family two-component response regulator
MNKSRHTAGVDPQQPRLLLVDDDEVNLLLTSIALRERGFAVTEVASGQQALDTLAGGQPDVVVLDALMPGMDGFETCRELRKLPACVSLPVLMLTGLDDDASINHAYEVGATDFFVKSNQWSLLDGRLRYLLRSSRTRIELERSENSLARAQDRARMGSKPKAWKGLDVYVLPHEIVLDDDGPRLLKWLEQEWKAHGFRVPLRS